VLVSKRVLNETYGKGFWYAIKKSGVKTIMSAYNAINGKFTSYNRDLLTGLLRDEWGYDGLVLSDWGAVTYNKEDSINAGMDLILCGPNDMSGCVEAIHDGKLTLDEIDKHVARILRLIIDLRTNRERAAFLYDGGALLNCAAETVIDGTVLLKNENSILPLNDNLRVTFYGKRSKDMLEFGSGSTAVTTSIHSNVLDEYRKLRSGTRFEDMSGADVLVYTAAAPSGENIDRDCMDIEESDKQRLPVVLKEAKGNGIKTVVILNVCGPVDMRSWIDYADAVICIFMPGSMGGVATAAVLAGSAAPGGKLPVTFPLRVEDTPTYPNFPGEHNEVYYGEGVFIGYRSYDARKAAVQYPFGYGLSYTRFEITVNKTSMDFDTLTCDEILIPVTIKNTGSLAGSEVLQIYGAEVKPHILRPDRELLGYEKVYLMPGEERTVDVKIERDCLYCFDLKQDKWVLPTGQYRLWLGTSSRDFFAEMDLFVRGINPYTLSGDSTVGEILESQAAIDAINEFTNGMFNKLSEEHINFIRYRKLNDILAAGMIQAIPDAVKMNEALQALYARLTQI
jgi:beta-glucosidase